VRWRLDAPDVACAARGELPRPEDAASLPRALPARPSREPRVAVEIPTSAPGLYEKNPAEAARARRRLRRIAKALFARGYEAVSIVPSGPAALYVFARR
jgi:predicted GNAT superfamily acetyltransferase